MALFEDELELFVEECLEFEHSLKTSKRKRMTSGGASVSEQLSSCEKSNDSNFTENADSSDNNVDMSSPSQLTE